MKKLIFTFCCLQLFSCAGSDDDSSNEATIGIVEREQFPGGETTIFDDSSSAFEFSANNL